MELDELNGTYELIIKTNAGGSYSEKPVRGEIYVKDGKVHGTDEFGVKWCGMAEPLDNEHVTFEITIDAEAVDNIVMRKPDGSMTDQHQSFSGTLKMSRKENGDILLSIFEISMSGEYNVTATLKRLAG